MTWDRRDDAEQRRVLERTLGDWLPLTLAATPFWRAAADQLGLAAPEARDLAALARLPAVRELDLVADDPAGAGAVLAPTEDQVKAHAPASSLREMAVALRGRGADGGRQVLRQTYRPLHLQTAGAHGSFLVASSRSDLDRMHRAGARAAAVAGLRDDDVLVSALRCGPTGAHVGVTHLAMGAGLTAAHPRTGDALDEVVRAVGVLSPSVLVVAVEEATALAEELRAARVPTSSLRRVLVYGPPPDEAGREAIVGAFAVGGASVAVRAIWAPSEARALWAECAPGSGLHTYPDLAYLEVVDPLTGAPTDGDGDLVLTSVGWHGTVLLRYRTGAWVDAPATEPCPQCGRTVPRLVGQVDPSAWQLAYAAANGPRVVDLRGVATALERAPGIAAWRAELHPPADDTGVDRLRVVLAGEPAADVAVLADRVGAACGMPTEVGVAATAAAVAAEVDRVGGVFADLR
ncbi:hypothetical protein [Egicoccus sp. AB-alg2]|uniref:hypothetical protein n=1 Tax=Egicoccus sp. AB-alg2 TaxID=3242693 RepID=UPI00359DDAED